MDFSVAYSVFIKKRARKKALRIAEADFKWASKGYEAFYTRLREHLTTLDIRPIGAPAEIWVGEYLCGKCFKGRVHPTDNVVYTNEYRELAANIGDCLLYVTHDFLEIQKNDLPEEPRRIPIECGYIDAHELIATLENTRGYYLKERFVVNGVTILTIERKPLLISISGKEIQGYVRNDIKCILLNSLHDFIYMIGTHAPQNKKKVHSYLLADIYDRKLRIEGHTLLSTALEFYNILDIEHIMDKCQVQSDDGRYKYMITDEQEKDGVPYITIAQP